MLTNVLFRGYLFKILAWKYVLFNIFAPIFKCVFLRGGDSFLDSFCYLYLSVILSCLFLAALWSPAGKWLTS